MNKQIMKYPQEYISYLKNGESVAVYIVRDIAKSINTEKKWISIIAKCDAKNYCEKRYFNYIICELFDRKLLPKYPNQKEFATYDQYNKKVKYITWQTAQDDINKQKSEGIIGPKYLLLCKLINKNRGKVVYENAYWNTTFQSWVKPGRSITPSCILKKRKIYISSQEPDWQYEIHFIKELTNLEFENIYSQLDEIEIEIEERKKATPDLFFKM